MASLSVDFQPFLSSCLQSWNGRACMLVHVNRRLLLPFSTAGGQTRCNFRKHVHETCYEWTLTLSQIVLDKTDITVNPVGCLLLSEFCYHVVFPKGPLSVTDLHVKQDAAEIHKWFILLYFNWLWIITKTKKQKLLCTVPEFLQHGPRIPCWSPSRAAFQVKVARESEMKWLWCLQVPILTLT